MTLASAAVPMYFYPFELRGNFYASGDGIAASPSMYAMQHAIDRLNKKKSDIRIVNVGNLNVEPDYIDPSTSLAEWIERLPSLYQPSKRHTMKYQS